MSKHKPSVAQEIEAGFPGWRKLVRSKRFRDWFDAQPEELQALADGKTFVQATTLLQAYYAAAREAAPDVRYAKGTKIVCVLCKRLCGVANRDILSSDQIRSTDWDGIPYGSTMNCPACGVSYARMGQGRRHELHTAEGWR